jgi:hypothetical protein
MSTLVIVFRTVSLLAFAGPMLLGVGGRRGAPKTRARHRGGGRAPVVANLAAFGVFFPALIIFSGNANGCTALLLAALGALLAVAGAVLVRRSRAALGPAWSFVPKAGQAPGLATTGPYRRVRHPRHPMLSASCDESRKSCRRRPHLVRSKYSNILFSRNFSPVYRVISFSAEELTVGCIGAIKRFDPGGGAPARSSLTRAKTHKD